MDPDPVLARRARIASRVQLAKRIGYTALLVAIVAFGIADRHVLLRRRRSSWPSSASPSPSWCCPIPIVLGYGVRAAEREERGGGSFH